MSKEAVNAILGICADHDVIDEAVTEAALHVSGLHPWRDNVELVYCKTDADLPNPVTGTVVDAYDGETCEPAPYEVIGCEVSVETPCYLRVATEGTTPETVSDYYAGAISALVVHKDLGKATELMQEFLVDLDDAMRRDQIALPTSYEFKTAYLIGKERAQCEVCKAPVVDEPEPDPLTVSAVQTNWVAGGGGAYQFNAQATVSGGTGPYTYVWESVTLADSIMGWIPNGDSLGGSYFSFMDEVRIIQVTATDSLGATGSDQVTITKYNQQVADG